MIYTLLYKIETEKSTATLPLPPQKEQKNQLPLKES